MLVSQFMKFLLLLVLTSVAHADFFNLNADLPARFVGRQLTLATPVLVTEGRGYANLKAGDTIHVSVADAGADMLLSPGASFDIEDVSLAEVGTSPSTLVHIRVIRAGRRYEFEFDLGVPPAVLQTRKVEQVAQEILVKLAPNLAFRPAGRPLQIVR